MRDHILQTKLHMPPLRSSFVPRERLIARLNAGLDAKLILVSAPAGYGKTTLIIEWLQGVKIQTTWLALDENDNDPRRFMAYLFAALRQIDPEAGKTAEAMLQAPQPPPGNEILIALVNEITAILQPFILVLDDYHALLAPPIHQQLNFLLEHLPPQMHLVIITREDPALPLARLRARGQMVEIRQEDLRFTLEECTDFINQVMGLRLPTEDISALERRTEGWIAGLQLAALSMRGREDLSRFIEDFTGSSHYVLDYLIEEVFDRQPTVVQDFLLKTSILDRFTAPLCNAVTQQKQSREMLHSLDQGNLFIIPLDQTHTWYRYHRLFAELLRQRLHSTETFSENELHHLASDWFAAEGLLPEAIQHALAAPDWDRAAVLVESTTTQLLSRGELMTLLGWFKAMPEAVLRQHPRLCRDYGWSLILTGQPEAAEPYLECAERAMQGDSEGLGQVMVAQAYLARARGDALKAIPLAKQALGLLNQADILHRSLVAFTLGFAYMNTGLLAEAEQALLEACETSRAAGNEYARLTALGMLGGIQGSQGKLQRAAEFCRQALQEAHGSPIAAQVQVFLAAVLYEWNDLEAAGEQLEQALKASQYIGNRAIQLDVLGNIARLKQAQGDHTAVLETLRQIDQVVEGINSPLMRATAAATHATVAFAQGEIVTASHWVEQISQQIDPAALGMQYGLIQARLLLEQGRKSEAGAILAGFEGAAAQAGMIASLIEVRTLQALAADTPSAAIRFLQDGLKLAQPGGYIRTFVSKGEAMKALLERLKSAGGELKPYILTLLRAFGETGKAAQPQQLVEAMSERELEILRLLADGLSNRDIAERLVISVGTTKSHVHHILDKLGGENRMQAVARARELGLL